MRDQKQDKKQNGESRDQLGYEWWEDLLKAQRIIQGTFPEFVLVGGTAAAIHCGHRISHDGDHVIENLRDRFEAILEELEKQTGWVTNRVTPPVVILGNFLGIDTGIRQLTRTKPLETIIVKGLKIPTLEEMTRIKAYLIVKRNATRDFIDLCALTDKLREKVIDALSPMDNLYPQKGNETMLRQLAKQLAEPKPYDLKKVRLDHYRGLVKPYTDWEYIVHVCEVLSLKIMTDLILKEDQDATPPYQRGL